MNAFVRGMIVPFFAVLVPGVWYVNRNLTTAALPPTVDPSLGLLVLGLATAVLGAAVLAALVSVLAPNPETEPRATALPRRVLFPSGDALAVFLGCMAILGAAGAIALPDLGPDWLRTTLLVVGAPLALPFLILAPIVIQSHLATIVGLAACPLWCSLLSTLFVDRLR